MNDKLEEGKHVEQFARYMNKKSEEKVYKLKKMLLVNKL